MVFPLAISIFFWSLTDVWTGGESEERDRARLEDKGAVAVCGDLCVWI